MSEYTKAENILIVELNKVIVELRSKVNILERELERLDNIPVPRTVINQVIALEHNRRKLQDDLNFYMPHIPENVKAKRNKHKAPTRKGGLR